MSEFVPKDVKTWAKSLFAATIGGAANAFFMIQMMPDKFSFSDLESVGKAVLAGALIGFFGYLKQRPLPTE